MSVTDGPLQSAQKWISLETRTLEELAIISEIEISPDDRVPRSVSWILDGSRFMAQVVLWEGGDFESDLADAETGLVQTRRGRVTSTGELESLLASARDWALQSS